MPSPATNEEFLELVRRAKVVDSARLDACLQEARAAGPLPETPSKLAELLVEEAVITAYQGVQILKGRYDIFRIGPYKILERLGFGATSNVYLCEHRATHNRVAVKVLAYLQDENPTLLKRFDREARAANAVDHPNIVHVHDVDWDGQQNFMVMEFINGSSIQDIIQQFGPMEIKRVPYYIRQAALGLQAAYDKGLVHRDIKPANMLIDKQGEVKILDMGLARFLQEEEAQLTRGEVLGTPEYLAPEQAIDSHNVDVRADIYGLGGTAYFMLTGEAPYSEEKSAAGKLLSKAKRPPKPIRETRPEVPEELVAIVDKMMATDREQRYQTPQEVAEALTPFTQKSIPRPPEHELPQLSPAARPGASRSRRKAPSAPTAAQPGQENSRWVAQVLVLVALCIMTFVVAWMFILKR